jgi:hypothetical protein
MRRDACSPLTPPVPMNAETASTEGHARAVVEHLVHETGLVRLMVAGSLVVSVGDGNWISFTLRLQSAVPNPPHAISQLCNALGKQMLRRCATSALRATWFRSKAAPSAHFQLLGNPGVTPGETIVQGHVDAADPWSHPMIHLVRDYLPAHGIGKHPTPEEILSALRKH